MSETMILIEAYPSWTLADITQLSIRGRKNWIAMIQLKSRKA